MANNISRVAIIGIIIEEKTAINELNTIISEYSEYIIGRMGIPNHKKKLSIISLALDAPMDIINALSGKIGRLNGVNCKTLYSNNFFENEI